MSDSSTLPVNAPIFRRLWVIVVLTCLLLTFPIAMILLFTGDIYRKKNGALQPLMTSSRMVYGGLLALWLVALVAKQIVSPTSFNQEIAGNQITAPTSAATDVKNDEARPPALKLSMIKSSMTQVGPDGSLTNEEKNDLANAFRVAFRGNPEVLDRDGKATNFEPVMLVPIDNTTAALISEGTLKEEDQCASCYGALEVQYLLVKGRGYTVPSPRIQKWIEGGAQGNAPGWKLQAENGQYVLTTQEEYQMERGQEQCTLGVYNLKPSGIALDRNAANVLKQNTPEFSDCQLR